MRWKLLIAADILFGAGWIVEGGGPVFWASYGLFLVPWFLTCLLAPAKIHKRKQRRKNGPVGTVTSNHSGAGAGAFTGTSYYAPTSGASYALPNPPVKKRKRESRTGVAPDLIQPVIGWRAWMLTGIRNPQLSSISISTKGWEPGVNEALCHAGNDHVAPDTNCNCGLYAYHIPLKGGYWNCDQYLVGAVKAWGQIQVHREGFRAEFMEIVGLGIVENDGRRLVLESSQFKDIPVVGSPDELEALAEQHGQSIPESLRPNKDQYVRELVKEKRELIARLKARGVQL